MGINPENLETSNVTITGVNGKQLQSQTRQMHVRIVNTSNQQESWEKVYVSEEIKISLVSKDCLIRLKILDPTLFLSDKEVRSFSVHTVEEKDSKLTECEKSFFRKKDDQWVAYAKNEIHHQSLMKNSTKKYSKS